MRLVCPKVVIEEEPSRFEWFARHLERAGRTCYRSEAKMDEGTADPFIRAILRRGHESVLEHCSFSARFTIDRGISHELVRHRLCGFSQESTRYCGWATGHIDFVIPLWLQGVLVERIYTWDDYDQEKSSLAEDEKVWLVHMLRSEDAYQALSKAGWKPQQARSVLPNSLRTEIVATANLREWRHIFKLRCAPAAHPQIREVMIPLLQELCETPAAVCFEDILEQLELPRKPVADEEDDSCVSWSTLTWTGSLS